MHRILYFSPPHHGLCFVLDLVDYALTFCVIGAKCAVLATQI